MEDSRITQLIILLTNLSEIARLFSQEVGLSHEYILTKEDNGISIKITIKEG